MALRNDKRYLRSKMIIDYLLEGGHNISDASEEFRVSKSTVSDDMKLFRNWEIGINNRRNVIAYLLAVKAVEKENAKRRTRRG